MEHKHDQTRQLQKRADSTSVSRRAEKEIRIQIVIAGDLATDREGLWESRCSARFRFGPAIKVCIYGMNIYADVQLLKNLHRILQLGS